MFRKFFRSLFPAPFTVEILLNGTRIFAATDKGIREKLVELKDADPDHNGFRANVGKGVQLRITKG